MRIRAYTLTVHVGHAPCWMYDKDRGCEILSLANCKPMIRQAAHENAGKNTGEWIAGVTPTRMGLRLAYLMRVTKAIPRSTYWARYKESRFDSIYKPNGDSGWIPLENPWHTDEESFARDLSSDWVLLSTEFYVFANSYSEHDKTPHGLHLVPEYCALARGGMQGPGHFIEVPDSFLSWIKEQPRLKMSEFRVLRNVRADGCGCCKEEEPACLEKCD